MLGTTVTNNISEYGKLLMLHLEALIWNIFTQKALQEITKEVKIS